MNFSETVKNELAGLPFESACCKRAALSAFVRGAGTIGSFGGKVGFEVTTDSAGSAKLCAELMKELYSVNADKVPSRENFNRKNRVTLRCVSGGSLDALVDLGICEVDEEGVAVKLGIDWYLVENDCCRAAYVRGMFLGGGSVTVPKADANSATGYHLEFVFGNYQTATDFCELLSELYFLPKLAERKGSYVVYIKTRDEITDLLATVGATKAVLEISELAVEKDMNNVSNRRLNCEMSNMTKQIDASVRQIRAVNRIKEVIGIDSLDEGLAEVAEARVANKDKTLSELAAALGISKSCLNHRLRKIVSIAEEL